VRAVLRKFSIGAGRGHGLGLPLLLLLVVLVPSICLLWFMTQAMRNERLAVRQKLVDAYRANLALAQERLDGYWKQMADELEIESEKVPAPALFANRVRTGKVDALICFDSRGKQIYPAVAAIPKQEALNAPWLEAQGVDAAGRCCSSISTISSSSTTPAVMRPATSC